MEKQLFYFPMISLEEIALRRIAVILVSKPDFLAQAEKFPLEDYFFSMTKGYPIMHPLNYRSEWLKTFSMEITTIASKIPLPESLASKMIPILKAVCSEVLSWMMNHKFYVSNIERDFSRVFAEKLCWTTAGTVDDRKTSEILVLSGALTKMQSFELACLYRLEDYLPVLWAELPVEDKRSYFKKECASAADAVDPKSFLLSILFKQHAFDADYLHDVRIDPLAYHALCGGKTQVEYSLRIFPLGKRMHSISETAERLLNYRLLGTLDIPKDKIPDVLYYSLSLMTPEEQLRFLNKLPCLVLECFFSWPWQDLFLDIADVVWTFLPEDKYWHLLERMSVHMYNSGYYLPNTVQDFFLRSPKKFREKFVDSEYLISFFTQFFHAEDSQTIKVVFRSLDAADKARIVFRKDVLRFFDRFILKDGFPMVKVCIRAASLSKKERLKLRRAFTKIVRKADGKIKLDWKTQKRKRFFELLDEMNARTGNKRKAKDETVTQSKKVCHNKNDTVSKN